MKISEINNVLADISSIKLSTVSPFEVEFENCCQLIAEGGQKCQSAQNDLVVLALICQCPKKIRQFLHDAIFYRPVTIWVPVNHLDILKQLNAVVINAIVESANILKKEVVVSLRVDIEMLAQRHFKLLKLVFSSANRIDLAYSHLFSSKNSATLLHAIAELDKHFSEINLSYNTTNYKDGDSLVKNDWFEKIACDLEKIKVDIIRLKYLLCPDDHANSSLLFYLIEGALKNKQLKTLDVRGNKFQQFLINDWRQKFPDLMRESSLTKLFFDKYSNINKAQIQGILEDNKKKCTTPSLFQAAEEADNGPVSRTSCNL